nr:wiskott-Aldrich syndrome protein homolog 1-like [Aegilops tauschii subsp. strangulata]
MPVLWQRPRWSPAARRWLPPSRPADAALSCPAGCRRRAPSLSCHHRARVPTARAAAVPCWHLAAPRAAVPAQACWPRRPSPWSRPTGARSSPCPDGRRPRVLLKPRRVQWPPPPTRAVAAAGTTAAGRSRSRRERWPPPSRARVLASPAVPCGRAWPPPPRVRALASSGRAVRACVPPLPLGR